MLFLVKRFYGTIWWLINRRSVLHRLGLTPIQVIQRQPLLPLNYWNRKENWEIKVGRLTNIEYICI